MAVVCACLGDKGQMISITPRSFTNGLYFKGLRSYLLSKMNLDLIHIFKFRNKVFKDKTANVLQENIICRFVKNNSDEITIRASDCNGQIFDADENSYPRKLIIDETNNQNIIRVPESRYEALIMQQAELFDNTFEEAGYFISTGSVVEHRTRKYITESHNEDNAVPLYRPHNIKPLKAAVTYEHKKDVSFFLNDGHEKHTLKNNNYVLLKRLSSKDENLNEDEAFGLAALFNSTFLDKYFRCISGNTQVNATEIRILRFPSRDKVKLIGEKVKKLNDFDTLHIDNIVNSIIGVNVFS